MQTLTAVLQYVSIVWLAFLTIKRVTTDPDKHTCKSACECLRAMLMGVPDCYCIRLPYPCMCLIIFMLRMHYPLNMLPSSIMVMYVVWNIYLWMHTYTRNGNMGKIFSPHHVKSRQRNDVM